MVGAHLVTGATGGIGAAIVDLLLEREHTVIAAGRDAGRLAARFPSARHLAVDLGDPATIEAALGGLVPAVDHLDSLVHCAGVGELGTVAETDVATWQRSLLVNTVAPAELTRLLLPALRAARGHVVMVNSGQGLSVRAGWTPYAASKFALRALADGLRAEEHGNGVRVTSVFPGRTDTEMQRRVRRVEGGAYEPDQYLDPRSVALTVLTALEAGRDAEITELTVRPGG